MYVWLSDGCISCRFPWDGVTPEDWWFCNKAADIYDELPENLKPALISDELIFSVESMFTEKPFATHKYWVSLPSHLPGTKVLVESCPEILGVFQIEYFQFPGHKELICSLNMNRDDFDKEFNITFDFRSICDNQSRE